MLPDNFAVADASSLAFAFMLVLCRCAGAVTLLPGLGEDDPPALVRVGLALALALLIAPVEMASLPKPPADFMKLAAMLAEDFAIGALLGWLARLLSLALPAAGQIMSLMTGQSSVLQPDPTLGAQSAALGRLFNLLAPVLILATGLYALPLQALAGSYTLFPPGRPLASSDLLETAMRAVSGSFALAARLAAPFILASLLWQVGLGLLSRLVPQIQAYFTALPGQVLGGLLLVGLLGAAIVQAWLTAMGDGLAALPGL